MHSLLRSDSSTIFACNRFRKMKSSGVFFPKLSCPLIFFSFLQVDASHSVEDSNNVKVAEDWGREDMFVDCSDEIEEGHQNEEGNNIVQEEKSKQLNNKTDAWDLVSEVQNLRDELEKTVAEKLHVEQDYEV